MTELSKAPTTTWWQVSLEVPKTWAEDASASLIAAGALGVQTVDDSVDSLPAFTKNNGAKPARASRPDLALLVASYAADGDGQQLASEAAGALQELGLAIEPSTMQVMRRQDSDWAERWKQYFKPIKIGRRMWIVPTWDKTFAPPTHSLVISLDPGMAFGTGQHATTALCLRGIEFHADALPEAQRPQQRVLDLGCGTGLLAIGAAKLGLGQIWAVDNDPAAVEVATQNIALNHVQAQVRVSGTPLEELKDTFHLIVANILAGPLIDMVHLLMPRLHDGGTLILSGILVPQADEVIRSYLDAAQKSSLGLLHTHRWTHGEWVALAFIRSK